MKICIIPARGGSKRIPGKNIKDFLGKPIISYSIETALKSELFDEVMVSTDCQEIAKVALKYGAKVPFMRSKDNSNDTATTMSVVQEVLCKYGYVFNEVCCLYPTAPLVGVAHLKHGLDILQKGFRTVFPVIRYGHPPQRGLVIRNNKIAMLNPEHRNTPTQELEIIYHDAGQWYWVNTKKEKNALISDDSGCIILKETEAYDIDTIEHWKIAEAIYETNKNTGT